MRHLLIYFFLLIVLKPFGVIQAKVINNVDEGFIHGLAIENQQLYICYQKQIQRLTLDDRALSQQVVYNEDRILKNIFIDKTGKKWIVTPKDVFEFSSLSKQNLEKIFPEIQDEKIKEAYKNIATLFIDSKDHFWIGTWKGLVDLNRQVLYDTAHGLGNNWVTGLSEDSKGMLYIGTLAGIDLFDGHSIMPWYKAENKTPCSALLIDRQDRIWMGTPQGLYQFNGERMEYAFSAKDDFDKWVTALAEDSHGRIWIGTKNYLKLYSPEDKIGYFVDLENWGKHRLALSQNFPNPFNPSTTIQFSLPAAEENFSAQPLQNIAYGVELYVHNLEGQIINHLISPKEMAPGEYSVTWNGFDSDLQRVSSGAYFYTLKVNYYKIGDALNPLTEKQFIKTRKMVIIK